MAPTDWRRTPWLKPALIVFIALVAASFFIKPKKKRTLPPPDPASLSIQEAVGFAAAQESARILGSVSGLAALYLPGPKGEQEWHRDPGDPYEIGFKKALEQLPSIQFAGRFVAQEWHPDRPEDFSRLDLKTLEAIRKKLPQANVLISFVGLPRIGAEEELGWASHRDLKIIALEQSRAELARAPSLLQRRIVHAVFAWNEGVPFPRSAGEGTHEEIFQKHYHILR